MTKHYVISLSDSYLSGIGPLAIGTVISSDSDPDVAGDRATALATCREGLSLRLDLAVITSDEKLVNGEVRKELANDYLARRLHTRATALMKDILDPSWRGRSHLGPKCDQDTARLLDALNLTLSELRDRYEGRAVAELADLARQRAEIAEQSARITAIRAEVAAEAAEFTLTFTAVAGAQVRKGR